MLRAKAVLCPGLQVRFRDEGSGEEQAWHYEDGLRDYVLSQLGDAPRIPTELFAGASEGNREAVSWAMAWLPEGGESVAESYVNLIPTSLGGTHVNGLRSGLTEAIREFCDFRNLLPRGVALAA